MAWKNPPCQEVSLVGVRAVTECSAEDPGARGPPQYRWMSRQGWILSPCPCHSPCHPVPVTLPVTLPLPAGPSPSLTLHTGAVLEEFTSTPKPFPSARQHRCQQQLPWQCGSGVAWADNYYYLLLLFIIYCFNLVSSVGARALQGQSGQ